MSLQNYGTDTAQTGGRGSPNAISPASDGQSYSQITGVGSASIVAAGGFNRIELTNDTAKNIWALGSRQFTDVDQYVRVYLSAAEVKAGVVARCTGASSYYRIGLTNGTFEIVLVNGASSTTLASSAPTVAGGTYYWLHFRLRGFGQTGSNPNNLQANFWADSSNGTSTAPSGEPAGWMLQAADGTLYLPGQFGFYFKPVHLAEYVTFDYYTCTDCPAPDTRPAYNTTQKRPYGDTYFLGSTPPPFPSQLVTDMVGPNSASSTGWGVGAGVRYQLLWNVIENVQGFYDWANLDAAVQSANYNGIQFVFSLAGPPSWRQTLDAMGSDATLQSAYNSGTLYTSIQVSALRQGAYLPHGYQITVNKGGGTAENLYIWNPGATYQAGATLIGISTSPSSQVPWNPANNHSINEPVREESASASQYANATDFSAFATLVASRYNGLSGFGKIDVFQIENEDYDISNRVQNQGGYNSGSNSPASWDKSSTWDNGGAILAPVYVACQQAIAGIAGHASTPVFSCAVRKTPNTGRQHIQNWTTGLVTQVIALGGTLSAFDFHFYRGQGATNWNGTVVNDPTIPTYTDSSQTTINAPDIATEISDLKAIFAANGISPKLANFECGWDIYDDGSGAKAPTTATYTAGVSYSSLAVDNTNWTHGSHSGGVAIADGTPIFIDYQNPGVTEQVYAYGAIASGAASLPITTNPAGSGAPQSAWTAQSTHASGIVVYCQTSIGPISTTQQSQYIWDMYEACRKGGVDYCYVFTINPPQSNVNSNHDPASATNTKGLTQTISSVYTYEDAYKMAASYSGQYPTWPGTPTPTDTYGTLILAAKPKAYYRLDESGGTVAHDSSGNGYSGTLSGVSAYNAPGALYANSDTAMTFTAGGGLTVPYSQINPDMWSAAGVDFWVNLGSGWHYVGVGVDASGTILCLDGALTSAGSGAVIELLQALDAIGSFVASSTLDEVAIYAYKPSLALMQSHYAAGIGSSGAYGSGAYTTYIGGAPVFVDAGTLSIDSTIGKRSTAQMTVHTRNTTTHYQQDQQVSIYDKTGTLVFSGYVATPKETKPGFQSSLETKIQCVDQHRLADKRRVAASYTNQTCGAIVTDILNKILSQEGVSIGQIFDGLTPSTTLYPSSSLYPGGNVGLVPQATFVYCTVAQALDALVKEASSAGVPYYWMIDQNKLLWFVPYTAVVNSTVIDGTQIEHVKTPTYVTRANPTYRNTQYITGGVAQTVLQVESRVGDGTTQSWAMGYGLAQAPTITVNGNAQTVGIKGVSATGSYQFYWAQGDPVITQDSNQAKLTGSDVLQVTYYGQYPTTYLTQNDAQISYEASLDGTSGIVEEVEQDATITTETAGLSTASNLLTRYGVQGLLLEFSTLQTGFAPGQLVTVDLPMHGINNAQLLIEEVSASDQADALNIWYGIKAVMGPYDVMWQNFFNNLVQNQAPANSINVGVGQSLNLLASFSAALAPTAALNVTVHACPLPATTLYPSTTLYPC